MASKSPLLGGLEKLARAPLGARLAALVGLLALFSVAYWYLFYSDLAEQRDGLLRERSRLANEEKKLQERKKEYLELLRKKQELEQELAKNAIKLPSSSELPAFFIHLQTQATAANVRVMKWDRENEIAVENFVKVPVKMHVRGDFYQLVQYFKLLSETPRIITVEDLALGNATTEGDQLVLTAQFTASTFRQADAPPAEAAPKPAPNAKAPAGEAGKRAAGAVAPAEAAASGGGASAAPVVPATTTPPPAAPPAGNQ